MLPTTASTAGAGTAQAVAKANSTLTEFLISSFFISAWSLAVHSILEVFPAPVSSWVDALEHVLPFASSSAFPAFGVDPIFRFASLASFRVGANFCEHRSTT